MLSDGAVTAELQLQTWHGLALLSQQSLLQLHRASSTCLVQGDHAPDNVKFPDNSLIVRGTRHVKCDSHHACTSTTYLYGRKYAAYNKQF